MKFFANPIGMSAALLLLAAVQSRGTECIENSTCTVGGNTYICDECDGTGVTCAFSGTDICPGRCNGGETPNALCDEQEDCGSGTCNYADGLGDGIRTRCVGSSPSVEFDSDFDVHCLGPEDNYIVQLSPTIDHDIKINAEDGDDTVVFLLDSGKTAWIEGGNGDDSISPIGGVGTVLGGPGSDGLVGNIVHGNMPNDFTDEGDDTISGTSGSDTLVGTEGDDYIRGGGGNDYIFGQGGRDVLKGEDGNDLIYSSLGFTPTNIILGSILCGGNGDDTLVGKGPGHQCMDAGSQQTSSGPSDYDCTYHNFPVDSDATDIGTVRNCANPTQQGTAGTYLTDEIRCGCDSP